MSDAPTPSAASQVPFLKNVSKSMKHKPEIIRKIARTASAKNSLDLNRPTHEQIHHFDSNPSLDGRDGIQKLNRSGSSLSGFGGSGDRLELGSRQRGLAGIGRGASYHARSTSGTSGISAWSAHTRESGGNTPIGGSFRHPWQQTPTVQRESFTGAIGGSGSYNEPNGFDRGGSDEDLRERERDMQGRRSLQLGGGYGLNLDGVDEGYERYQAPAFQRPAFVRSNTSATVHSGVSHSARASYRESESRTYTSISQLPPPLAGSKGRGMGGLRVNTSSSGISVAGVAGRGAGAVLNSAGGTVTPVSSSSRVNLGSLSAGGSNPDVNSASGLPLNNNSNPILHNFTNNISTSTAGSTLYNTVATSDPDLYISNLNNSTGHLHTSTSGSHITSHPDISTTSPIYPTPSTSTFKPRPSFDMHLPPRLRGKSEPHDIDEARRRWDEKEAIQKAKDAAELGKQQEKERVKEEKRLRKQEKRGRNSTTSIGSFALGNRGRSDTGATGGTATTYSTAIGSVASGVPSHRRGGSGATARQNSGIGHSAAASYRNHSYNNSYDLDDPANTHAPAFLDTGEYVPSEAEMAAAAAAAAGRNRQSGREGSPKVKEVKEKIYAAKSKSHSAWASFMLWLKTRILKMGRSSKKIVKGKKKAQ